jgi:hypothetical protein
MKIEFDEQRVREEYARAVMDGLHLALVDNIIEDPEEVRTIYMQLVKKCCKRFRITMGKSEIFAIYQKWVNEGKVSSDFILTIIFFLISLTLFHVCQLTRHTSRLPLQTKFRLPQV